MTPFHYALLISFAATAPLASAHGDEHHQDSAKAALHQKQQTDWGIAGDAKDVKRTIEIRAGDAMRFTPDQMVVRQGDTVRIVVHNDGKLAHETVIGTKAELDEHAALMRKFPNMVHDEPHMTRVEPGATGEIVWKFNRKGEFEFACLMPGHYEAGMVGKIKVAAR